MICQSASKIDPPIFGSRDGVGVSRARLIHARQRPRSRQFVELPLCFPFSPNRAEIGS